MKFTLMAIFLADDELSNDWEDDELAVPEMRPAPADPTTPAAAWLKLATAEAELAARDELAPHKLIANGYINNRLRYE